MSFMKLLLIYCFFIGLSFSENVDSLSIKDKYESDSWKMSLHPSFNMVSAGQLNNNKPLKAITLTTMKIYWFKEFLKAQNNDKLSDRSRAFWWFLFLYFYSIVDAAVDIEMQTFPENDIQNKEVE